MNGGTSNRLDHILVAAFVLFVVVAMVPGTVAATNEVGVSVVVERGETLDDDLTAGAGSVLILGTVNGDVTALAGNVVVTGEVTGDVTAVGGNVEVVGEVGGSVTTFAINYGVSGVVGGDVDAIVGALAINGTVGGNTEAIGIFTEVERGGRIVGTLQTTAYRTAVNGTVLGTPARTGNETVAGNETTVAGETTQRGGGDEESNDGNQTAAAQDRDPPEIDGDGSLSDAAANQFVTNDALISTHGVGGTVLQIVPGLGRGDSLSIFDAYGFLVNLLLGAILVGWLPNFSTDVASLVTRHPIRSGLAGVGVLIAAPIVLLVLALSFFGFPLALAGGALYLVASWVGVAYGRFAVGTWVFVAAAQALAYADIETETVRNRWARLLTGYVIVALLLRVPYLGTVVDGVVLALGIGALSSVAYEAYQRSEGLRPSPVAEALGRE